MKPTTYRKLANATVVIHIIWIIIMIVGIPMFFIFDWYRPIFMTVTYSTFILQVIFQGCPLVALETAFQKKYDPDQSYYGSFICGFLDRKFGIKVPPFVIVGILVFMLITSSIFFFWLFK